MKNIKYVSLNDSLFLGGKNHGLKIFNGKAGIKIEYDQATDHVKIFFNDEMATIKHYNTIVEHVGPMKAEAPAATITPPNKKIKAQVSAPYDHVFAEAPGKVRN